MKEIKTASDLASKISNYLESGGLFNPESMEHDKVRELILEIREHLLQDLLQNLTTLHYQPPTTMAEPKQKTIVMAKLRSMEEADMFKAASIKKDSEMRKGSWFFGGVRI